MKIAIKISDDLSEEDTVNLLNLLWMAAQVVTKGKFNAGHDGDPALSRLANTEFDQYAKIRWQ